MNTLEPEFPPNEYEISAPNSREAEEALLGSVLIHPALIKTIDIYPVDFYTHRCGMVWETMQEMSEAGISLDFVTLTDALNKKNILQEIGGPAYLTGLLSLVPTSTNAESYARIIRDRKQRRNLIEVANDIARQAYALEKPVIEIQSGMMEQALQAAQVTQGSQHIGSWLEAAYDRIYLSSQNGKEPGTATGYLDYDRITGGVRRGRMEILSGIPGKGKSIWAMGKALGTAKHNLPSVIYSIEMVEEEVINRLLSAETHIPVSRIERGQLKESEWPVFTHAFEVLNGLPLFVNDATYWTIPTLRADLNRLRSEHGVGHFVLDYMDLLADAYGKDEVERSKYLARQLKAICKDMHLHGTIVQSMVKSGFSAPNMEHLSGSVGLAYTADLIMFIADDTPDDGREPDPNVRLFLIKKGRQLENPERYFYMYKHPNFPAFGNLDFRARKGQNGNGQHPPERELLEFYK